MISSEAGSMTDNTIGRIHAYRASKTALNSFMKTLAIELKRSGVLVMSMHPGWIQTDMGGSRAPLTVDQAIPSLVKTVNGLTEADQGIFKTYENKVYPW